MSGLEPLTSSLYEGGLEGSPAFIAVRKPAYLSRFRNGRTPLSFPVSAGTGLLAVLQQSNPDPRIRRAGRQISGISWG